MDTLAPGQLRFAIHGPDVETDDVAGVVFARKLADLILAVKAADRAVNRGKPQHEYYIRKLTTSTPTVILDERPIYEAQKPLFPLASGIAAFRACTDAIEAGDRETVLFYSGCAKKIAKLASGNQTKFRYAEVWTENHSVLRVDAFLGQRVERISSPVLEPALIPVDKYQWFEGTARSAFDGLVKAVDLRGSLPELKLVLSAGEKQIDCVGKQSQIEDIKSALNLRCRVSGLCSYEADSGLPRRMEVSEIEIIGDPDDFTVWAGTFSPFDDASWEDGES